VAGFPCNSRHNLRRPQRGGDTGSGPAPATSPTAVGNGVLGFVPLLLALFLTLGPNPAAHAQSVATGLALYQNTALPGTGTAAPNACSGCHISNPSLAATAPTGSASAGHLNASNNPSQILTAMNAGGAMAGYYVPIPSASQRLSLALFIGQYKAPAFTVANGSASLALAVRSGVAGTKDIYPLIVGNGSGGAARDGATGLVITSSPANGSAVPVQVSATTTMNYNVTYTSNAGYTGSDSVGVTVANPTGSDVRTIAVTVYGINSATTATGFKGQTYTAGAPLYQITSNDGAASTFTASGLPAGLSVNAADGKITGTPTVTGSFTVTIGTTINSAGVNNGTVSNSLTLTLAGITSAATANGTQNAVFPTYQITSFPTPPSAFALTGTLPTGLVFTAGTGQITGTATVSGSFPVTIQATTTAGVVSQALAINIASAGVPVISTTPTLPVSPVAAGTVGQAFTTTQINATNPPINAGSYAATGLPAGLSVNVNSGVISGTPTQSGDFVVTLSAANSSGTGQQVVTIRINANSVPAITSPSAVSTTQNQAFAGYQILATNPPVTGYTASGLPPGLSLNTVTGQITGTPTQSGVFNVTVSAINNVGTGSLSVTFTILPTNVPGITSPTSASGTANQVFPAVAIVATNPPITGYGGSGLPPGISVNPSTGAITGTPTQPGVFNATLTAINNAGTGSLAVTFTVTAAAPSAGAVSMTVPLNTPTTLDLAPNITGFGITGVAVVTAAAHGTVTVNGTRVTYTPTNNYFGSDSFSYVGFGTGGTSPPGVVTVTVVGRPDPTKDAAVVGLLAAQADAALRFTRAQISNFQRRMESLHRRSDSGSSAVRSLNADTDRVATARPAAAAVAAARQIADDAPAFPNNSAVRVASAPAALHLPDSQGGGPGLKVFPLVNDALSLLTTRSVNLGSLAGNGGGADGSARALGATSFWIEGNASFGTRDPTGSRSGLDFSTSGISVGADRRFGDQWALGIGAGFARDKTDIGNDGSQSRAHGFSVAAYGSYQPGRNLFVDGLIGVGALEFDTQRFVAPVNDFARADRDGYQVFGSLAAGYEHRANGVLVSPYARLDYSADRLNQATEAGAGQYALTYFRQTTSSVQGALGLRAESIHATSFGWAAPRIRVEFRHEFQGERLVSLAYADLIGGPRFAVSTGAVSRNALAFGIGSDFVLRDGLAFGIDYQLLHSFSQDTSHAIRLSISKELDGPGSTSALRRASASSGTPLDIRVDAGYLYDDNVTRSKDSADKLSDHSYSVNASKVIIIPVTDHARALLTGFVGGEKFHNYDGLSRVLGGVQGEIQYRPSAEFSAPTFALFARASAEQYESELRDGYRHSIGISVRQPVTDRIQLFGALAHNERYADSAVFNNRDNSLRLNVDYALTPTGTLYLGGEYRRGDAVSSGRASLESIDIAKVFVRDDAFPGQMYSYRFDARTVLTTVGYNLGFGPRDSLDFSWRRAESTPSLRPSFATSSSSYIANQFSIVYLTRF